MAPDPMCVSSVWFLLGYVGEEHILHLTSILKHYHKNSWEGKKFVGINLEWDYAKTHKDRTHHILTKGYIADLLLRPGHPKPANP